LYLRGDQRPVGELARIWSRFRLGDRSNKQNTMDYKYFWKCPQCSFVPLCYLSPLSCVPSWESELDFQAFSRHGACHSVTEPRNCCWFTKMPPQLQLETFVDASWARYKGTLDHSVPCYKYLAPVCPPWKLSDIKLSWLRKCPLNF
jgi:hypothetical protein